MAKRNRLVYTAAALIPLSVLAAACGSSGGSGNSSASTSPKAAAMVGSALPSSPNSKPETITETGSTLLYPLMGTWTEAYQKQFVNGKNPIVTIETGGTGSGTGITDADHRYRGHRRVGRIPVQLGHADHAVDAEYRAGDLGPADQLQPAQR